MHTIQLKGPWKVAFRPAGPAGEVAAEQRTVQLPAEWRQLFGERSGCAVFERRFNRPTGLTADHRVWIQLRDVGCKPVIQLNGETLTLESPDVATCIVEITGRMNPHNVLSVAIAFDPACRSKRPGGLWQPVLLRIEELDAENA